MQIEPALATKYGDCFAEIELAPAAIQTAKFNRSLENRNQCFGRGVVSAALRFLRVFLWIAR
jgi:hypothetical protein